MATSDKFSVVFISRTSGVVLRGVETFVHEMGNRLSRLGLEITVIQNGPAIPNSLYRTISLHLPPTKSLLQFSLHAVRHIPSGVKVVVPINGSWLAGLARVYTWVHRSRLVITGHAGLGRDDFVNLWCFPNVFIAQTSYQASWAKRLQPLVKLAIIPSGVDTTRFNPQVPPHKFNLPHPIILNVGALESIKRQDLLIKAAAKLPVSVLLVGQGSREKELWDLGWKYLGSRFQICHFSHRDMPGVYAACDLLAYPSGPWESFGLAIIEAMAVGKPVVVTNDPIRQEIVGSAGLVVDPVNISAFSQALGQALSRHWGSSPRRRALNFSWDQIAQSYFKLFTNT